LRSKATFSLLFSLLSFLWKRQFKRREKSEKIKVKRTKRNDNLPKENCRFFLVEARRIELLSENRSAQLSPGAVRRFLFPEEAAPDAAFLSVSL